MRLLPILITIGALSVGCAMQAVPQVPSPHAQTHAIPLSARPFDRFCVITREMDDGTARGNCMSVDDIRKLLASIGKA